MIPANRSDSWRSLYASGLLSRFVVLCFGIWLHAADSLVTATIAPAIVDDIGGVAFINWTIMLYQVGAIIAGAASPMMYRRTGVKGLLGLAALVYGGGCLLGGLAPDMAVLLAGRFAQGLGGGILLSLCYLAILEWFDLAWWSRLFGFVAFIWGAGSLLGPLIGGIFAGLHAWRLTFFVFAGQAAALGCMAALWLPRRAAAPGPAQPRWSVLPLVVLSAAAMLIAQSSIAGSIAASADRWLIRIGAACVALGAGGFAVAVPAGVLAGLVLCALLQGLGFGLCWPSIVHRLARYSNEAERPQAVSSPDTMQRIGYAVGAAAVGIAANLAGLAAGISVAAAKSAAFWVFASFVPLLIFALISAWLFTRDPPASP